MSSLCWRAHLRAQLVEMGVDTCNLVDPLLSLSMLHIHHLVVGPVKVKSEIGYLLAQPGEGVANYPPRGTTSAWYVCPQAGHVVWTTF